MSELFEKVQDLKIAREIHSSLAAQLKAKKDEYEKINSELISMVSKIATEESELMTIIRDLAVEEYRVDPAKNKKPVEGVGIKIMKSVKYELPNALAWAISHKACLIPATLDKKGFEALAKATGAKDMPAEIIETPTATISEVL